jgi:RNA polymerase sigma-70 factor (ECF subfamily)
MGESASDEALLDAWRGGDEDAGNALLRRHFMMITRFFERRTVHEVEELVQATFLGCVKSSHAIPPGIPFRAYALGVARNQLLMHIRTRSRRKDGLPLNKDVAAASSLAPSRVAAAREDQRKLLAAMGQLTEEMQTMLELHYWEQLTVREIGAVMAIPEGTIKVRLSQARRLLKDELRKSGGTSIDPEATLTSLRGLSGDPGR